MERVRDGRVGFAEREPDPTTELRRLAAIDCGDDPDELAELRLQLLEDLHGDEGAERVTGVGRVLGELRVDQRSALSLPQREEAIPDAQARVQARGVELHLGGIHMHRLGKAPGKEVLIRLFVELGEGRHPAEGIKGRAGPGKPKCARLTA